MISHELTITVEGECTAREEAIDTHRGGSGGLVPEVQACILGEIELRGSRTIGQQDDTVAGVRRVGRPGRHANQDEATGQQRDGDRYAWWMSLSTRATRTDTTLGLQGVCEGAIDYKRREESRSEKSLPADVKQGTLAREDTPYLRGDGARSSWL